MSVAAAPAHRAADGRWLFTGEIEHRDSAGHHALVRPGELNLMTAGHGISHSEVSTPETTVLHGAQLWVALPDFGPRRRAGVRPPRPRARSPARAGKPAVFLGSLLGDTSPVATATPAARRRAASRAPAPTCTRRRPGLRARRAVDTGVLSSRRRRDAGGTSSAYLAAGLRSGSSHRGRGRRPGAAARRPAVRRGDRDVVELRRPQPRGRRRPSARRGWRSSPRAGTSTARFGVPTGDDLRADPGSCAAQRADQGRASPSDRQRRPSSARTASPAAPGPAARV